jgi:hypothetical protein
MIGLDMLVVAGTGEAGSHRPELFEARTRATVRYADSGAWITAAAVGAAISGLREELSASLHDVGMIVVSDRGPTTTMAEVNDAALKGFSSPLRYSAASPGTLVGVACIAYGFRGPTLNLTMRPKDGVRVAIQLSENWLFRGVARYMVVATFAAPGGSPCGIARAVLLNTPQPHNAYRNSMNEFTARWLASA